MMFKSGQTLSVGSSQAAVLPTFNIDEQIEALMNSVSRDKRGQMVVRDCLTEPALVDQIITRAIDSFKSVKTMLELRAPLLIVGDLHGRVFE